MKLIVIFALFKYVDGRDLLTGVRSLLGVAQKGDGRRMHEDLEGLATFVVKAEDLRVLDQLIPDEPQPISLDWINRATNQKTFYGAARAKPNRPPESPLCVPLPSPT